MNCHGCGCCPCSCKPREYKVGQKWLTKYNNTWEILGIKGDEYWVQVNDNKNTNVFPKSSVDNHCDVLLPKTIKVTVISYKQLSDDTGKVYTMCFSENNYLKSLEQVNLERIIDIKEVEVKCE